MALTHQVSPQLGQLPFLETRETLEESFASDEAQYGISQEFQLFIISNAGSSQGLLGLLFARLRCVRERLLEKLHSREAVA